MPYPSFNYFLDQPQPTILPTLGATQTNPFSFNLPSLAPQPTVLTQVPPTDWNAPMTPATGAAVSGSQVRPMTTPEQAYRGYGITNFSYLTGTPNNAVGTAPTATRTASAAPPENPRLTYAKNSIDPKLGAGWSAEFANRMGVDPITFYAQAFVNSPQARDPAWLASAASNAAYKDGINHPWEVAQWQQLHGNTPIPEEQWQRWWYANQQYGSSLDPNTKLGDGKPVVF